MRTTQPKYNIVKNVNTPPVETAYLKNGVPVYFVKTTNKDISEIIFNFDAGVWNQSQLLVASMTKSLLSEGTKYHSAKEIADIFDHYGAHFSSNSGMHSSSVKLMALNKYFPILVELVAEILNFADFPENELKIAKNKYKQQLIINLEEEDVIARNSLESVLYGDNCPYGWAAKPEDYDKLTTDLLKKFFLKNFVAKKMKIIVASHKKQEIIDLLNKHFGDFRSGAVETDIFRYNVKTGEKYILKERDDALQSAVRIAWKMFERKHKDNVDMSILETFLGGYFGSRLMQNIRQKKGYTYSIYSALISYKYNGSFQIISEVKKENKFKVVDEIKNEILRLQNEPISDEELTNVRSYMMGGLLRGLDGNFTFTRTLHSFIVYDLGFDYLANFADRIQNITPKRLQELAQKYLKIDDMFTVIVG